VEFTPALENGEFVLRDGGCLGMLPEGKSNEHTDIIPFRAGLAIIILNCMVNFGIEVPIQCVGQQYFQLHKFRSQMLIKYGRPFTVP
jgi:glycerol-3-phosphate O-acyltransferase/dihydroxyacetone phosphate acyltransferase